MDEKIKVATLDWRMFGDYSAVGQLTKKIFSAGKDVVVYPLLSEDDGTSINVFKREDDGSLSNVFNSKIAHDAAINYICKIDIDVLYVRLSPNKGVLEFAMKLIVALPYLPLIVHYMDKPSFAELSPAREAYFNQIYRHLVLHADQVYTIHKSSLPWLREKFGREGKILANFIEKEPKPHLNIKALEEKVINISYFGSIDHKMNADAIACFCRAISNLSWVQLTIWSNSGIWGPVKEICGSSKNITIFKSNLDDAAFKRKLSETDVLLLPYNFDDKSKYFLKHSFSNKFVDYLEAGGAILCFGDREIPTVQSCHESGLAIVIESEAELLNIFSSKKVFLDRLGFLNPEKYLDQVNALRKEQLKQLNEFFGDIKDLKRIKSSSLAENLHLPNKIWAGSEMQNKCLAFLIRRKFYDSKCGQQQSLSATLMSVIIKSQGYSGFDYWI